MRAVLIVLGIAIGAIIVSILVTPKKDLTPDPLARREEREQAERDKAAREGKDNPSSSPGTPVAPPFNPPRDGVVTAVINVAGRGDITFEMYPKAAPKTVAQISKLIREKFYDGIIVHRVDKPAGRPAFVVQFGNPATKTEGVDAMESDGDVPTIPFERNNLPNIAGSISMALKREASDTATSQMFINLSYNNFLDSSYCVFGKVITGMDVVNKIERGDKITSIVLR
jgi:cyclophilin family peptidyl-prolyl cis-trans isomerase